MVTLDGKMAMAVLPASRKLSLDRSGGCRGRGVELAGERAFRTVSRLRSRRHAAFGNLYGMEVYVSNRWPKTTRSPSTPARTPS